MSARSLVELLTMVEVSPIATVGPVHTNGGSVAGLKGWPLILVTRTVATGASCAVQLVGPPPNWATSSAIHASLLLNAGALGSSPGRREALVGSLLTSAPVDRSPSQAKA